MEPELKPGDVLAIGAVVLGVEYRFSTHINKTTPVYRCLATDGKVRWFISRAGYTIQMHYDDK